MSAKHTPSPWECDDDGEIIGNGGVHIASVSVPQDFPCLDDDAVSDVEKECQANARLIAAAPELLEACRKVLLLRDWVIESGGYKGPLPRATIEQFAKIQRDVDDSIAAAIAKAESGQ